MTKSQCYAEIAQKQREIADYNAKIQKLNSFRMFSVGLIRQLSVLCWKLQRNKMK